MKLLFDARVLTHKHYTGVENYTQNILENLFEKLQINIAKPKSTNKYITHLWSHFILPFKKGNILFCPANTAPVFVPKNKKLVLTIHDVAFKTFSDSISKFFYWYYCFLIPRNIKRADIIITISEASKKEILHFYPEAKDKILIIPLGIDKKYRIVSEVKKKKQILYVGSMNERKNLVGVLEAFERLPKNFGYNLVIVGNFFNTFTISEKFKKILIKAKKNDAVLFKQGLDDIALINEYNASKCLVFPSFYEGFGLPPLEAMACGTPVIVSDLSSMPEVCSAAAIYVDPYSIEDIKEKIQMLLEDKILQKKMISKGIEQVAQFTWEKAVQEYIKVFKIVLNKENN
jgi:glycosyltransferase involved in cell wall biosynthesis